jgi:hypothetical protein
VGLTAWDLLGIGLLAEVVTSYTGGSNGPSKGSRKSGLFNVQSDLREHLARSEEASLPECVLQKQADLGLRS